MVEWTEPIRDVLVKHGSQTACGSGYARVLIDFEPADAREVVVATDHQRGDPYRDDLYDWCLAGFRDGVREAFSELDPSLPGVRVVVRKLLIHEVDSSDYGNRRAGRLAVDEWRRRLPESLPSR